MIAIISLAQLLAYVGYSYQDVYYISNAGFRNFQVAFTALKNFRLLLGPTFQKKSLFMAIHSSHKQSSVSLRLELLLSFIVLNLPFIRWQMVTIRQLIVEGLVVSMSCLRLCNPFTAYVSPKFLTYFLHSRNHVAHNLPGSLFEKWTMTSRCLLLVRQITSS